MSTDKPDNAESSSPQGIELANTANYDFEIGDTLKEGWQRTSGLKAPFWGAAAVVFAIMLVVGFIVSALIDLVGLSGSGWVIQIAVELALLAVIYPFMAGIFMMGVRRSVDLTVSFNEVFAYFAYISPLIVAGVLMSILVTLGFMILIIPGIYLAVAYIFTVPLIVDRNLSAWQAMETSRKAVTQHWFRFFAVMLCLIIIIFISMIPFGIGLIWTYPMMIAVMGILYRDTFGVTQQD
jgi:uncharacterized membrane protein